LNREVQKEEIGRAVDNSFKTRRQPPSSVAQTNNNPRQPQTTKNRQHAANQNSTATQQVIPVPPGVLNAITVAT
jgi:hypothetical protein